MVVMLGSKCPSKFSVSSSLDVMLGYLQCSMPCQCMVWPPLLMAVCLNQDILYITRYQQYMVSIIVRLWVGICKLVIRL